MDELQKLFAARGQFQNSSSSEKSSHNSNNLNENGLKDTPNHQIQREKDEKSNENENEKIKSLFAPSKVAKIEKESAKSAGSINFLTA